MTPESVLETTRVNVNTITANNKYESSLFTVGGISSEFIVQYKPTPEHQEIGRPLSAFTKMYCQEP